MEPPVAKSITRWFKQIQEMEQTQNSGTPRTYNETIEHLRQLYVKPENLIVRRSLKV